MKIYCFFYVGIFCLVALVGFLISLWVSYKTTYNGEESNTNRLPKDGPDYEPAYQTALDDDKEQEQ